MNTSKVLFTFLLGVIFSPHVFATENKETCISNAAEFAEKSASLPAVVQKLPALLTADGFFVTAGLKIRVAGDKLKLEGYVWKPGEIIVDDGYISKACYDGKVLNVTLENGTSYSAKIKNEKSVSIQGVTFDQASEAKFAGIVKKIKDSRAERTASTQSGVN